MPDTQEVRPIIMPDQPRVVPRIYVPPVGGIAGPRQPVVAPPGGMPLPQAQGNNPFSRIHSVLRNPMTQAWLLNVGRGLAQPRGPGQTGVTNMMNALAQGYDSLAAASEASYQRGRQMEQDRMAREQHEQALKVGEEQIKASEVGREATKAGTGKTKAETEAISKSYDLELERLGLTREEVGLKREALDLQWEGLAQERTRDRRLDVIEQKKLKMAEDQFKLNREDKAAERRLEEQRNKSAAVTAQASATNAKANMIEAERAGQLDDARMAKILADARAEFVNSLTYLSIMQDPTGGREAAESAADEHVRRVMVLLREQGVVGTTGGKAAEPVEAPVTVTVKGQGPVTPPTHPPVLHLPNGTWYLNPEDNTYSRRAPGVK